MLNNKFYFKKSKGQNFLKNKDIINKIIDNATINNKMAVIEIGPGNGALTDQIISKCKKLILIEIDPQLIEILEKKYKKNHNVLIINEDILKINLREFIKEYLEPFDKKDIIIMSNLPYYITSPILFKIFSINNFINHFVLTMQKEVGERILAKTNEKKYNNLSIVANLYCDIQKIVEIPKHDFFPVPKVNSMALKFTFNKKYNILYETEFTNFIRKMFNNKRKMIINNLSKYLNVNKQETYNLLLNCNINPQCRPENISLKNYYNLWENIIAKKNNLNE